MKKGILIALTVILLCVLAFSVWKMVDIWLDYRAGEQFYVKMNDYVSIPETEPTKPPKADQAEEQEETIPEEAPKPVWPQVDFAALQAINSDVVGWIYIPDTNVNYPILQGKNNDQYIYHLMTGEYNSAGSIFLEAGIARDFSAKNSVIYGHNMKNGTMFAGITGYKSQEFYDAHPTAMLLTPEGNYYVHIFSGYVTDIWGDAWDSGFSEDSFRQWLNKRERQSYFTSDVIPTQQDRILTFSTCTYETDDARFVVHGVLEAYVEENTAD